MNPPRVEFRDGKLIGVVEFENWAMNNDLKWRAIAARAKTRRERDRALYYSAYRMTIELIEARKKIFELEMIAPRRIKGPDGSEYIWHCPNDLIPLDSDYQSR